MTIHTYDNTVVAKVDYGGAAAPINVQSIPSSYDRIEIERKYKPSKQTLIVTTH